MTTIPLNEARTFVQNTFASNPQFGDVFTVVNIERINDDVLMLDLDDGTTISLKIDRYQRDVHDEATLVAKMTKTWTFLGHWTDESTILVTRVLDGQHEDDREDDGTYEGGLWADSGTGVDVDVVQAAVVAEYER